MAQTSSAQREPSMEEILASIRRIIEDSDSARQPHEEAGEPQFSMPVEAGEVQQEVEAFRAGLDERDVSPPDASGGPAMTGTVEPEHLREAPEQPQEEIEQLRVGILPFVNGAPASEESGDEPVRDASGTEAAAEQSTPAPAWIPDTPAPAAAFAPAEARPSLISDHAGRQVAAAFGELSEAFAASRRRSFDEMAEEMLRPMLQDWLDNNLPTLVERLVREEIERVARGG